MATTGLRIRWRTLEWWGVSLCLFLQTGGLFVLLMSGPEGELSDEARAKLRLLALPVYAIASMLLIPRFAQLRVVLRRNLPLVFLLGLPFLSILWSVSPSETLRRAIGLLGSTALAFLIAIRFSPRQILLLLAFAVGPCILLSLVLIAAMPGLAFMPMGHELRGVFTHKNVLGRFATLSCLVAACLVFDRSLRYRRAGGLLLVASLLCLVLSNSMTSLFAAVVGVILAWSYSLLARQRRLGRFLVGLLLLQFAAMTLIFLQEFLVPMLVSLGKDATLTGRVPLWRLVDQRIDERLLLGFGFQAFWTDASPDAWSIWSAIGWMAPNAHNGYRETLLGLGLVGFAALAVVVGRAVRQGAVLHCAAPQDGWLWLNVLVGGVLVMNLTESMFLAQNDLFWTLFMTACAAFGLRAPESPPGGAPRLSSG